MKQLFLVLGLLAVGCGGGAATDSTCPTGNTLTYANFGQQFFTSYCNSCHSSGTRPALGTVAEIRANSSRIDSEAAAGPNATNTYMPEGGSTPTTAERTQLGQWLACGAP